MQTEEKPIETETEIEEKPTYEWAEGFHQSGSAQVVGETLMLMTEKHGDLKPELVVKEARKKSNPLHSYFEWDDGKAADEFRKGQARYLIRSIRVVQKVKNEEPQLVRVFHHVEDPQAGSGYQPLVRVMSDKELREQAIGYSLQYLQQARKRLTELRELEEICSDIAAIEERLDERLKAPAKASAKAPSAKSKTSDKSKIKDRAKRIQTSA